MDSYNRTQPAWGGAALWPAQSEYPGYGELTPEIGLTSPFNEVEEMDLAAELLEVSDEAELDQFLGKLIKGAWRGIKKVGRVLKPLGGVLKAVARKALPFVGGALGSFIPIPGVGTALGTAVGGALSSALEMEFESLSPEDREFEMARRFVRLAGTAARQAALAAPGVDPQAAVRDALLAATRQQVPGAMRQLAAVPGSPRAKRRSGQWVRQGHSLIVLDVQL